MTEEEKVVGPSGVSGFPNLPDEPYYTLPGREQGLNRLLAALENPRGPLIIAISGLGGVGKTALAGELARRALQRGLFEGVIGDSARQELFAGGEIIQMKEASLDFDLLLDSLARQLNRWDLPTMKVEEKRASLAQLLRQHRYLVLVDNLEKAENTNVLVIQLRSLLGQSRAILTTSKQVHHDVVQDLPLGGLDLEDSLIFLQRNSEQHGGVLHHAPREKLIEIHQVTGGVPLAMKFVVAQARFLDLDMVLRRLRQHGTKLYSYIFRQSWEELSQTARLVLIYIGRTVTTTVSWEELASVGIAENEQQLRESIDQLVAFSLLEVSFVAGQTRYGIHALTQQFVNIELPELWQEQGQL